MSAAVAAPILREDDRGITRSLPFLAALMEAEAHCCTATASRLAESGFVRASPKVPISIFMEQIHLAASRRSGRLRPTSRALLADMSWCPAASRSRVWAPWWGPSGRQPRQGADPVALRFSGGADLHPRRLSSTPPP
ncbi:unnamed protein product [Urochloa humidicola]